MSETLNSAPKVRTQIHVGWMGKIRKTGGRVITWLSHLSIWQRLLLGTLLGALGGSTFIGFLNNYAVYNFAYQFGARVPVEGVPYLSLAASIISFAFLFLSLSCATLVYGLLVLITKILRVGFRSLVSNRNKSDDDKKRLWRLVEVVTSLASGIITAVISAITSDQFSRNSRSVFELEIDWQLAMFIVVSGLVLAVLSMRPAWVKWFAAILTLGLVATTSVALFQPEFYGAFLRGIRYGGGTPISLVCEKELICSERDKINLFLITSETYLLFDSVTGEFVEIPKSEVDRVRYRPTRDYILPSR